jgi:hypothetical protein
MKIKHTLLIILFSITALFAEAQNKAIPDTALTIKTTNNQLYQIANLFTVASNNLLKSQMAVADYVEFQKQYQALLQAWFKQKEEEDKAAKKPAK